MALNLNLEKPLAIVGVALGLIVGLSLLAAFLPGMFDSIHTTTDAVTNGTVGNDQADGILHVFAFVVPIVLILGVIGIVFAVSKSK